MKNIISYINETIFNQAISIEDVLTDEELNYKFKHTLAPRRKTVNDIILDISRSHKKNLIEVANEFKLRIYIDKLLSSLGFFRRYCCLSDFDEYLLKTDPNDYGYSVVFDPFNRTDPMDKSHATWNFLVCESYENGETLKPIEWVEPKSESSIIHNSYGTDFPNTPKTFYDDIDSAWKYIEKKYGKF